MITETIIVATITAGFAFAGVVVSNHSSNKKNHIEQSLRDQKIAYEIQELTKRVDAHNGLSDRIANIEKSIVRIDVKLEGINNASNI